MSTIKFLIMKKLVFIIFVVVVFSSCSSDPREQLVSDYEQTSGDTKTDLSLKVLKIVELGSVTANDSLMILEPEFAKNRDEKIESLKEIIQSNNVTIEYYREEAKNNKYPSIRKGNLKSAQFWEDINKGFEESIEIYNSDCKETFLESIYNRINDFKNDTSRILYNKAKVTYSIKNPFLNNVKQELTKVYMFTPDNKIILGVIE